MIYTVVTALNPLDLRDQVQRLINFGWTPLGGVSNSGSVYSQAMTGRN